MKRRILLNPGPVTTSDSVKKSLLMPDNCHREKEVADVIKEIRESLVKFADGEDDYTSILFASSGTGAMEAVITSVVPDFPNRVLVLSNGAYGERFAKMVDLLSGMIFLYDTARMTNELSLKNIESTLKKGRFSSVIVIHHETTTGILNPIKEIGKIAKKYNCIYIVDAISSFGGIPFSVKDCQIDFLIGTANKCIQGIPGVSFVIAKKDELEKTSVINRNLYFKLFDEEQHQRIKGIFRFTAPIQILYAFRTAIRELKKETIKKRYKRYCKSYDVLLKGMIGLGFKLYNNNQQSKLLATFYYPTVNWNFDLFHDKLYKRGFVVYPGKLSINTFRVAVIGDINYKDIQEFLKNVKEVMKEMKNE